MKITRFIQKIFGKNNNKLGVFGSYRSKNNYQTSDDPETIQSLAAFENGYTNMAEQEYQPMANDFDGLFYTLSSSIKYLNQRGIAEWHKDEEYPKGGLAAVFDIINNKTTIWQSLDDGNINHYPLTSPLYWKNRDFDGLDGLNNGERLGEIKWSIFPISGRDENCLKVLNGQWINGSLYPNFLARLKSIELLYPNIFVDGNEWVTILNNSKLNQCGKFVIVENVVLYYFIANGTDVIYTKSLEDLSNVTIFDQNLNVLGTGSLSSEVLTYDGNTYNYDSTKNIQSTFIRLPKIVNFVGGTIDFTTLGDLQEEELPNLVGKITTTASVALMSTHGTPPTGVFSGEGSGTTPGSGSGSSIRTLNFNANDYSPTYKDGGKAKQEAVKGFYYIVVANGVEEEIDPVRQVTINNNPMPLFASKYDNCLNGGSGWIRSDNTYLSKTLFPDAFDALLIEINTDISVNETITTPSGYVYTKRGLSVKYITDTYTDFDFVIDNTNETFRLPLITENETMVPSNKYDDLTLGATGTEYTAPANGWYFLTKYATGNEYATFENLSNNLRIEQRSTSNGILNSVYIPVKKGDKVILTYSLGGTLINFRFVYSQNNSNLFFYLYTALKNIDIANTEGLINEVQNIKSNGTIIESWGNEENGYEIYMSNGKKKCKQWGFVPLDQATTGDQTITLYKEYNNVYYWADYMITYFDNTNNGTYVQIKNKTTNSFTVRKRSYTNDIKASFQWMTEGYID